MHQPTHYEMLDVEPSATADEVKRAYRRASKTCHPDAGGNAAMFRLVQTAYQVLSDPDARARYDRDLAGPSKATAAPPHTRPQEFPTAQRLREQDEQVARARAAARRAYRPVDSRLEEEATRREREEQAKAARMQRRRRGPTGTPSRTSACSARPSVPCWRCCGGPAASSTSPAGSSGPSTS